jgi:hypothetical protein
MPKRTISAITLFILSELPERTRNKRAPAKEGGSAARWAARATDCLGHSATRANFVGEHSHAVAPVHFPALRVAVQRLFGRTKRRKQPERYVQYTPIFVKSIDKFLRVLYFIFKVYFTKKENMMKQTSFFALLLVGINVMAFSLHETWISTGFEFGNSIENSSDEGITYIGAPGFNLNAYGFSDKRNIGIFFHYSFLFPVIASGNGDIKDYDLQMEFIIGPGFRYNITENLKLQFGMGFDWMLVSAMYNQKDTAGDTIDFSKVAYNLGIGGDIGFKYDITDFFYINGGVTLSYMFFNNTWLYSFQKTSNDVETRIRIYDDNIKGYSMFGIKPYICIGFNYYQEKVVWGKPKE